MSVENEMNIKKINNTIEDYNAFPDASGHFGIYGGSFVAETLMAPLAELTEAYDRYRVDPQFIAELKHDYQHYVGRPSPIYEALRLSQYVGGARIFLKREDLNHTGAHKINNTIGQILVAKRLGKKKIVAETGAGQHGVATATVCALMGLECIVYMGEIDIERQAPNVARMKMLGAEVRPAMSGSKTLKDATNEAMRHWINNPVDTHYIIGSVVGPHPYPDMVAKFQSVISEEIKWQLLEKTGKETPDFVIACVGGGSNAAGAFYHFLDDLDTRLIAVEAGGHGITTGMSAATTFLGKMGVLHGSKSLLMQTPDGQVVEPHSISAGLDYPGIGPMHANLWETKRAEFYAITDEESLESALELSQLEGIIPALETAHAIAVLKYLNAKPNETIVINLSGRGDKDLNTYMKHIL